MSQSHGGSASGGSSAWLTWTCALTPLRLFQFSPVSNVLFCRPNIISKSKDDYFHHISKRFAFTATLKWSKLTRICGCFLLKPVRSFFWFSFFFFKTFSNFFHHGFLVGVFIPHDLSVQCGGVGVCVHNCAYTPPHFWV